MNSKMNSTRWFCIALLTLAGGAISLTLTGCGGRTTETRISETRYVGVPVPVAPPAVREEVVGTPPNAGDVWIGGYWDWNGKDYVWMPGHWESARAGYRWVPDHWDHEGTTWRRQPGHWEMMR